MSSSIYSDEKRQKLQSGHTPDNETTAPNGAYPSCAASVPSE